MPLRGNTETFNLSDLFQMLDVHKYSGTLKVSSQDTTKFIFFTQGELQLTSWPQNKNIRLGSILVKQQKITEEQLDEALHSQRESSLRLGEILIERGYLTEGEIHQAVREKLEEEIYEIFMWESAYFEFFRNQYPLEFSQAQRVTRLSFNVKNLLMEGLRRADEWKRLREAIPSDQIIFQVVGELPEVFQADDKMLEVLNLINGQNKIEDILDQAHQSNFEVFYSLSLLLKNQVISPISLEQCRRGFEENLNSGDMEQAIRFVEAASVQEQVPGAVKGEMVHQLISHREFSQAQVEHRLSLRLQQERLAALVVEILVQKHRGTLLVSVDNRKKYVVFNEGEIHIYDNAPAEHLEMGQILLRQGKVVQSTLDHCNTRRDLDVSYHSMKKILLSEGQISERDYQQALREKIAEEIAEVFLWDRPYFSFRKNHLQPPDLENAAHYAHPLEGDFHRELVEVLERWKNLIQSVSHMHMIFTLTDSPPSSAEGDWKGETMAKWINGKRNIQDLLKVADLSQMEMFQSLYRLLNQGRIRPYLLEELDRHIERTLSSGDHLQAIKYCQAAYEQSRAERYRTKISEIRRIDQKALATGEERHLEGDLFTFPLRDLFQILNSSQQSGTFTLDDGHRSQTLFFNHGEISLLYFKNGHSMADGGRHSSLVFYQPEPDHIQNDLLELFHWNNARFRFVSNYFPEYYYLPDAQQFKYDYETQLLLMESIKQQDGIEFISPSIPSLQILLRRREAPSLSSPMETSGEVGNAEELLGLLDASEEEELLRMANGRNTVLDLYKTHGRRDINQFLGQLEDLIDDEILEVLPVEEARSLVNSMEKSGLEYTIKLYQHILTLSPDSELDRQLQELVDQFTWEKEGHEHLYNQPIQREGLAQILRKVAIRETSGTLIFISPTYRLCVYLSSQEIWLYHLDRPIDFADEVNPIAPQEQPSLSPSPITEETLRVPQWNVQVNGQPLSGEEWNKVLANHMYRELLETFTQPQSTVSFLPRTFPLQARRETSSCLVWKGVSATFFSDLIAPLTCPLWKALPLRDCVFFQAPHTQEEETLSPYLQGRHSVGEIAIQTGLTKGSVWRQLAQMTRGEKLNLVDFKQARKEGEEARQRGDLRRARTLFEYARLGTGGRDKQLEEDYLNVTQALDNQNR